MDLLNGIVLIHIFVGFILVYFAFRAYKRTRYVPMLSLAFGFVLITLGDTIVGDIFSFGDNYYKDTIEELVEISGFVLVILAIVKS